VEPSCEIRSKIVKLNEQERRVQGYFTTGDLKTLFDAGPMDTSHRDLPDSSIIQPPAAFCPESLFRNREDAVCEAKQGDRRPPFARLEEYAIHEPGYRQRGDEVGSVTSCSSPRP